MSEATLGLRESLENAIDNFEPAAETVPEVVADETPAVEEQTAAERARDEKGRFSRKDEPAAEPEAENAAPQVEARQSPKSWKKEVAEKYWNSIDPELQEEILRREEAVSQGFDRYKSDAQYASELKQVLEPFNGYFEQLGVNAPGAINHLLNTEYRLRNGSPYEKAQTFMQLANAYGVNIGELATQNPDPSFAMQNELAQLRGMYNQLIQTQQQSQEQQVLSEIEQFAQNHQHLDEVRDDMALLLSQGRASTLEDAYNKAIRLHDHLFNQVQSANRKSSEVERREQADRAAKAAKSAAVSVKGSRSGTPSGAPTGDLRSMLDQAFDGRL